MTVGAEVPCAPGRAVCEGRRGLWQSHSHTPPRPAALCQVGAPMTRVLVVMVAWGGATELQVSQVWVFAQKLGDKSRGPRLQDGTDD